MKIAVPTRQGRVDEHFGHCESFTVLTLDENRAVAGEESFTPPPGCGCKSNVATTLRDMGVTLLIGGNMGEGAAVRLRSEGIAVVRGASGPVRQAVADWAAGRLADSKITCLSHGHAGCGNH
ncbi:MAG: NifB/NifX family molybdenum-iron cluster-binding protein [Thermodesulfobacteriota bacterium]